MGDAKQIRLQIHNLIDDHCKDCTKKRGKDELYCVRECSIGQQIHELGKQLVGTKKTGKEEKVMGEPAQVQTEELTRGRYLELKKEGLTDVEIRKMYGFKNPHDLTQWKKENGLGGLKLPPTPDQRIAFSERAFQKSEKPPEKAPVPQTDEPKPETDSRIRYAMVILLQQGKTTVHSRTDFLKLIDALEVLGIPWEAAGAGAAYTVRVESGVA